MSLETCCIAVIPEFGVKWRDVSQAVRNARLPMVPSSVARVLYRHAAKTLPQDELEDILGRLKLKCMYCLRPFVDSQKPVLYAFQ